MGDLIERDAVAYKVKSCITIPADNEWDSGYNTAMAEAEQYIQNAPAVNRWIPVSERMPDDELPVIVAHIDSEGYGLPSIGMFRGNPKKWVTSSAIEIVNVTHWMQMPELPVSGVSEDV